MSIHDPVLFWLAFIAAITAAMLLVRWVRDANRRTAERMISEWALAFPGRCPLCSFHRHAELNGANVGPLGEHYCPEGNSVYVPKATARRV